MRRRQLAEARILGNEQVVVIAGKAPDAIVSLTVKSELIDVAAAWILGSELIDEGRAQVFIEKQFHSLGEPRVGRYFPSPRFMLQRKSQYFAPFMIVCVRSSLTSGLPISSVT